MKLPADIVANTHHLRRLFFLRNLFILAQLFAFCIAILYAHMQLQLVPLLLEVFVLAILNAFVWRRLKSSNDVSDNEIFRHLLIDTAALTIVLYFTGGASNPFITLFIFPLIIAVTVLPRRFAWVFMVITVFSYTLLMFQYIPMKMTGAEHDMDLHVAGMWMAFVLSAGLVAHFVVKMGATIREQEDQLIKAREAALRDRQIIELGTLAASTAHELGTPLGTMNLLVSELKNELINAPAQINNDLDLLNLQIDRCKNALSNLSVSAGAINVSSGRVETVSEYLTSVLNEWKSVRPNTHVVTCWSGGNSLAKILDDRTLTQAVMNILDNAADASLEDIEWDASWDNEQLVMEIRDRGYGFAKDFKVSLGRSRSSQESQGLGLGLFLSHAIIERFGGTVNLINRDGGGMTTRIAIPLIVSRRA